MSIVEPPAEIAILGAGPIGLEAALYARFLGYTVRVYEQEGVASHVLRWAHLPLARPFGLHCSRLGLAALMAQDADFHAPPDSDSMTAGRWVEHYLRPLSQTDLLAGSVQTQAQVIGVDWAEPVPEDDTDGRPKFLIRLRTAEGDLQERADVVLDTTGVQGSPRGSGLNGVLADGEQANRERIDYGWPDFERRDCGRFAGRHTLVIGSGCSAMTNLLGLLELADRERGTRISWLSPGDPLRAAREDPVLGEAARHREGLQDRLRRRLRRSPDAVQRIQAPGLASLQADGDGWRVASAAAEFPPDRFDRLIVNTGFRTAWHWRDALRGGDAAEAPPEPGPEAAPESPRDVLGRKMAGPVSRFFELGAKACGGHPDYVYTDGLNQIRQVFALLAGRDELDLYKTICV